MEREEVLANHLKELRTGRGWFEPFPFLPDNPLCAALGVPKRLTDDRREDWFKGRLKYFIDNLDDELEREALLVAYNLHPDYKKGPRGTDLILGDRRRRYTQHLGLKDESDCKTVKRREGKAIEKLARQLEFELTAPIIFGRYFTKKPQEVYRFGGRPIAKSHVRAYVALLMLSGLAFLMGMVVYIGAITHTFEVIKP